MQLVVGMIEPIDHSKGLDLGVGGPGIDLR